MSNTTELLGLHRLELVGREQQLSTIFKRAEEAREKKRPLMIRVQGKGGIGKTALLEQVIKELKKQKEERIIPEQIIDLYFLENHTAHGLMDSIVGVVGSKIGIEIKEFKQSYESLLTALSRMQRQKAAEEWKKIEDQLVKALGEQSRQIWLVFDTFEALGEAGQQYSQETDPTMPAINWLKHLARRLKGRQIVILVASRPTKSPEHVPEGWLHESIEVSPLTEKECEQYLQRLAKLVRNEKDQMGAENIEGYLSKHTARKVWQQTGGQPLRLAMVGDILRSSGSLPAGYYKDAGEEAPKANESELTRSFMGLATPIGITLQTLALLHKGADAKLIAELMGIPEAEAKHYLEQVSKLTLVKRRPYTEEGTRAPRQYFLHDEIYMLYAMHIPLSDTIQGEVLKKIDKYYQAEIEGMKEWQGKTPALRGSYWHRIQISQVERMHYALWYSAWGGLADYFVQSESAINQRSEEWATLLESEFQHTHDQLKELSRLPEDIAPYTDWIGRIREVDRLSAWGQGGEAKKHLTSMESALEQMPRVCAAYWWLVRAALIARGQDEAASLEKAEEYLSKAEEAVRQERKEQLATVRDVLLGFIENYRGFIKRKSGQYHAALNHYQAASIHLRRKGFQALSGVLVNMAYVMSMLGYDQRANETATEAHELASRYGTIHEQIRALNMRSMVAAFAGEAIRAIRIGEEALTLLAQTQEQRLTALLYVALGRAKRYEWNRLVIDELGLTADGRDTLIKGLVYLEGIEKIKRHDKEYEKVLATQKLLPSCPDGAIHILRQVNDPENLAIALNECGALWRELAWHYARTFSKPTEVEKDKLREALNYADEHLREAAGLAQTKRKEWMEAIRRQDEQRATKKKDEPGEALKLEDERPQGAASSGQAKREEWAEAVRRHIEQIGGSAYIPALALVNLGWHYHYQTSPRHREVLTGLFGPEEKQVEIELLCKTVEKIIGQRYLWKENEPPVLAIEQADILLWAVLGKMEMLRGYEALREWRGKKDKIPEAVRHIALAIEYDYLTGQSTWNARRAFAGLEKRIRQSRRWEEELLPEMCKALLKLELRSDGKELRLYKWVKERFGDPKEWAKP